MQKKLRKNGVLVSVIVLVLCAAIYLNWSYERNHGGADAQDVFAGQAQTVPEETAPASDELRFEENRWQLQTLSGGQEQTATDERLARLCANMDEMRLSLETSRSGELTILQESAEDMESSAEARASAQAQIAAIAANSVMEAKIESLIVAKGFVDCIALAGPESISVVIVPEKEGLQPSDVAKISDIILTETDYDTTQIRVIESQ